MIDAMDKTKIPDTTNSGNMPSVPNSLEQKEKTIKEFFSAHKSQTFLIGGIFLFFMILFFLSLSGLQHKKEIVQEPTPVPVLLSPTPQPSPPLPTPIQAIRQINLFTIYTGVLKQIGTVTPEKFLYYIDHNTVVQYSLNDSTQKTIYSNTKLATQISNITFIAPEYLYISIIIDSSDPLFSQQQDRSSYLIEYTIPTHAIRTIGPLKTITRGNINYLFHSQDEDILNVIETSYCKQTGAFYSYASGSAAFLTADGLGCNGRDPYLAGIIPDQDSLLLADPGYTTKPDDFVSRYERLYSFDIRTKKTRNLFNFSKLYETEKKVIDMKNQIRKFALSDNKTLVYYVSGKKIVVINLEEYDEKKKIIKKIDLTSLSGYTLLTIIHDTAYLFNNSKQDMSIVDLHNESVTHIPTTILPQLAENIPFLFLGMWNNQPVFSIQL